MKATWSGSLSTRLFCLDFLKAISITAVVSYHSIFVSRSTYTDSLLALDLSSAPLRFCVPVLFTISFLLLERGLANRSKEPTWKLMRKRLLRVAVPTIVWFSLVIGLKFSRGSVSLSEIIPYTLRGDAYQGAYYLVALLQFLLIFAWLRNYLRRPQSIVIVLLLQGAVFLLVYQALSGNPALQPLLSTLRSLGRPCLIYWFGYVALGIYFHNNWPSIVEASRTTSKSVKFAAVGLTCFFLIAEDYLLFSLSGGKIVPFDYSMFSCVISAITAFICFASIEEWHIPKATQALVYLLSRYSLGIFCINGILSEILLSFGSHLLSHLSFDLVEILAIKLLGWLFLLGVSLLLSILLDRIGLGAIVR